MSSITRVRSPRLPPTIDFSDENLEPGSSSWISMKKEVRRALEEFGCFHVHYDSVSLEDHKKMYDALDDLFDLPRETKMKHVSKDYPYLTHTKYPLGEGTGIVDAAKFDNVQSFTSIMWPHGNPSFCETMYAYIHGAVKLEQIVKRMVFESLGLEKYYDTYIESSTYAFRGNIYTPQENETYALPAHTDKTFLTILHQNGVNGLEVETKDGRWIPLTPSPSAFTVMVGDSFMAWSNGRLHSVRHRVILNGTDRRLSFVLFGFTNGMVQTPEELVDEEHPILFKPFKQMDLLHHTILGRSTIKDIYGV